LEKGNLDVALDALKAAVDLMPAFSSARVAYAVALAKYGDSPRAAQTLRAGLGRPSSAVAAAAMWATLGDVLTVGGDFYGAEDAFNQAGEKSEFEARAASGLARVYGKLGRYGDAFVQLDRVAQLHKSA